MSLLGRKYMRSGIKIIFYKLGYFFEKETSHHYKNSYILARDFTNQ